MNTVAFLTLHRVGIGIESGWHEEGGRRALIVQGEEKVRPGLGEVEPLLSTLDHLVIYLDRGGWESALRLADELSAQKVTVLICICELEEKRRMIEAHGLSDRLVLSECGGIRGMETFLTKFLATGEFPAERSLPDEW